MAIAYDNAVVNLSVASTTNNTSLTVGSGNTIIFAGIFSTVGDDLTSITATKGGIDVAMTQIDKIASGSEEVYLYYLIAPDSGTVNVKATFSTSVISRLHVSTYTGANQSGVPDAESKSTAVNGATASVVTIADNCWTVLFARGAATVVAGAGSTERPNAAGSSSAFFDSNAPKTPAGSTSMTYTDTGSGAYIMASFAPSVTVSTQLPYRALQGVGK